MRPAFLILGTIPLKKRHNAQNVEVCAMEVFKRFEIDKTNIHMLLRDAHSVMVLMAGQMKIDSFSCFLHKIHLVVLIFCEELNKIFVLSRSKRESKHLIPMMKQRRFFTKCENSYANYENLKFKKNCFERSKRNLICPTLNCQKYFLNLIVKKLWICSGL